MNSWHLKIRCILQEEKSHNVMEERKDDSEALRLACCKEGGVTAEPRTANV